MIKGLIFRGAEYLQCLLKLIGFVGGHSISANQALIDLPKVMQVVRNRNQNLLIIIICAEEIFSVYFLVLYCFVFV